MSEPLIDFRLGIPAEIDNALSAYARGFGTNKQDIAREILREWVAKFSHATSVHEALKRAYGITTASTGIVSAKSDKT